MRLPEFITFTGLDARTDLRRVAELTARYAVEWGVLFSPSRQGCEPRYPRGETQSDIWWSNLPLAAHLCGQHARDIMDGVTPRLPVDLSYCRRVQVNHPEPEPDRISKFCHSWGNVRGIAQARGDAFPASNSIDWLFDCSAGTGKRPDAWPRHPGGNRIIGYAGGIRPDNVVEILQQINSDGPYWIDMESGVRTDDWLDLDKVEAVCRAVFETTTA